jgi:hypothetical protein
VEGRRENACLLGGNWKVTGVCCWWLVSFLLAGKYMREHMEKRIHRIAERMSGIGFPIVRKTGRNWGPVGGHTLSALVRSFGVIFSQFPQFARFLPSTIRYLAFLTREICVRIKT